MAAGQQEGSWTPGSASNVPYSNQVPKPSAPLHRPISWELRDRTSILTTVHRISTSLTQAANRVQRGM